MNAKIIFCFIFFLWPIPLYLLGFGHLFKSLGGIAYLYFYLPIFSVLCLKIKGIERLVFSCVFQILSLVLINYIYSDMFYFVNGSSLVFSLLFFWFLSFPLLIGTFLIAHNMIAIIKEKVFCSEIENGSIKDFDSFLFGILHSLHVFIIPFLLILFSLGKDLRYVIIMSLVLIFIANCIITLKIDKNIIYEAYCAHYFKNRIIPIMSNKVFSLLLFTLIIFLSLKGEHEHRNSWVLYFCSIGVFFLSNHVFFVPFFCKKKSSIPNEKKIRLPSIKDRGSIITLVLLMVSFIFAMMSAAIIANTRSTGL